jgi:hypothetical protein
MNTGVNTSPRAVAITPALAPDESFLMRVNFTPVSVPGSKFQEDPRSKIQDPKKQLLAVSHQSQVSYLKSRKKARFQ